MPTTVIHVNRHFIAANAKDGGNRPVCVVKTGRKTRYGREVQIDGPSRVVYDGSALKCGARLWIETEAPVFIVEEMTFEEARKADQ